MVVYGGPISLQTDIVRGKHTIEGWQVSISNPDILLLIREPGDPFACCCDCGSGSCWGSPLDRCDCDCKKGVVVADMLWPEEDETLFMW